MDDVEVAVEAVREGEVVEPHASGVTHAHGRVLVLAGAHAEVACASAAGQDSEVAHDHVAHDGGARAHDV